MNQKAMALYSILIVMHLLFLQSCYGASFFEMVLEHDSIYTPGKMNLTLNLTDKTKIQGDYKLQISVYVTEKLMRKQILPVTKEEPVVFELAFPEVYSKTDVRCRMRLFIDDQFVEAEEKPLTLWPPLAPYPKRLKDKVIWVFDVSGRLQKIFYDLEVEMVDATFQVARSFGIPDIVFIGQDLDPNSMQVINDRLGLVDNKPVTIFLKQKELPKNTNIIIPQENNRSVSVTCNLNSPLFQRLNKLDVMHMLDNAIHIKVKKDMEKEWIIDSYVTEVIKDRKNIYSYLLKIEKEGDVAIYCQLPAICDDDPRRSILLENLLELANKISDSQKKLNEHSYRKGTL